MHQALCIPEILLNIIGHCAPPATLLLEKCMHDADLAMIARTCRAFREPALDVLWEELLDLSPLVRCIPEACRLAQPAELPRRYRFLGNVCYVFSRQLKEAEWNTLRGYACRVRFIRGVPTIPTSLNEETMRTIFSLAPFTDPLFSNLRSLCWREEFSFAPLHVAVPSLTTLQLDFQYSPSPPVQEFFDAFGGRCLNIEKLEVDIHTPGIFDSEISRQIRCWPNLRRVLCYGVALNADAILHLSSIHTLKLLLFTLKGGPIRDISRAGSILVFSNLTYLHITSKPLDIVASFFPYIRLPATETLSVITFKPTSRRIIQRYWDGVREACSSQVITCLQLRGLDQEGVDVNAPDEELHLRLDDLRACTVFTELRELHINLDCSVRLTDADLVELALPHMQALLINDTLGWKIGVNDGGITLSGLVQLLRQCPSLHRVCIAIDTRTFTQIPEGLNVSFPPRKRLEINFVDSYILPEFVPGLVSVFAALGLDGSLLTAWDTHERFNSGRESRLLWERVLRALRVAPRDDRLQPIIVM